MPRACRNWPASRSKSLPATEAAPPPSSAPSAPPSRAPAPRATRPNALRPGGSRTRTGSSNGPISPAVQTAMPVPVVLPCSATSPLPCRATAASPRSISVPPNGRRSSATGHPRPDPPDHGAGGHRQALRRERSRLDFSIRVLTGDPTGLTALPAIIKAAKDGSPSAILQAVAIFTRLKGLGTLGKLLGKDEAAAKGGQASTAAADDAGVGSKAAERITWVDEVADMSPRARTYDDGASGSRSNVETRKRQAPALPRTTADGRTTSVRFDGIDGDVLVDRKISVVTTPKAKEQVLRQSEALQQNGLTGRWEVPTQSQADRASRMFNELA